MKIIPPQYERDVEYICEKEKNDLFLENPYMKHGQEKLEYEECDDKEEGRKKDMFETNTMKSCEFFESAIGKQKKKNDKCNMKSHMEKEKRSFSLTKHRKTRIKVESTNDKRRSNIQKS